MLGWYLFAACMAVAIFGNILYTFITAERLESLEETVYEDKKEGE